MEIIVGIIAAAAAALLVCQSTAATTSIRSADQHTINFTCSHPDVYYYALPDSRCAVYYRCNKDRTRLVLDCPPGSTFDFFKQVCTREAGICYEPVCTGRTDGHYQDTTHACRRSMTCRHGRLSALDNCAPQQLHDGRHCRRPDDVICDLPQSTAIGYPYSADRRCAGLPAGRHVAVGTDCRRYITCDAVGKVLDDVECADGWRFDEKRRQCMPETQATSCEGTTDAGLCTGRAAGLHPDPMAADCEAYIRCAAGGRFVSRHQCGALTAFNGVECVLRALYECTSSSSAAAAAQPPAAHQFPKRDLCKHKTDGMWSDPRHGCRAYVRCERGISAEPHLCGRDQYFDPESRRCARNGHIGKDVGCRLRSDAAECEQLERGFYPDKSEASSCRNYFHCYNGNRTEYRCSEGRLFDGENCVLADTYVCPNRRPDNCAGRADGYYKGVHASCRSYYLCSQGHKYGYLCGEFERFDGADCVRRKAGEMCPNMGACAGRSDGYYADLEARCRNYYFCLKQEVLTTLTCQGSRVYNGERCVSPAEFRCPAVSAVVSSPFQVSAEAVPTTGPNYGGVVIAYASQQIDCVPRPRRCGTAQQQQRQCDGNGFFADIASGCVEYYFCIGQTQSGVLRCSEGNVFNGEICVRRERYTCPQYCDTEEDADRDEC